MGGPGSGWFASAGHVPKEKLDEWKNILEHPMPATSPEGPYIREKYNSLPKEVLDYENSFKDSGFENLQKTALTNYTGTHYERLNYFLRHDTDIPGFESDDMRWEIPELNKAINNAPDLPEGFEVFRGVGKNSGKSVSMLQPGDICSDKAYQSHSLSLRVANNFSQKWTQQEKNGEQTEHRTIVRAVTKKGTKGIFTNRLKEYEILFPRETKWKVTSKNTVKIKDIYTDIISVEPVI